MIYGNPLIFGGSGGGGPTASDAILTVTAPAGSTVTATKGGTSLTPTMWTAAADATQECALFVITATQFDATTPWTVTISDGTNTASDTILIGSNKQYGISLDYNLWLVKNGKLLAAFTPSADATITQEAEFVLFLTTANKYARISTGQIDITDYSALKLVLCEDANERVGYSYYATSNTYPYPALGYGSQLPSSDTALNFANFIRLNSATGDIFKHSFTVNLTSASGLVYITLALSGSTGTQGFANIYDFYLER